ncbi:hypothetical protein BGZ60DRAFT_429802 [Tricladium varicosporioides]|nr:hypothetical protein BGZ60DRAFT_429802 [Hymenoscyphus varicosporioides]
MDTINVKRNDEGKRRKRKNERINKRKDTLIKKAYELGEFDGVDVALVICKYGRYTIYRSRDHVSWPPSIAEMQNKYPFPVNILPQDIKKRSFKISRKKTLAQENKDRGINELS